jgi:spermidine synthase
MFLLSLGVIALEITITRIFSFTIWYHYAFFVIAIALLGLGASGVAASLLAPRLVGREPLAAAAGALLFAAGTWGALGFTRLMPLDPLAFGRDPGQAFVLLGHVLALTLPFLGGGFAVAVVLQSYAGAVGRLYWADLAGAALGAVLPLLVLAPLGAPRLAALAAALGAAAAVALAGAAGPDGEVAPATRRRGFLVAAACAFLAVPLAGAALAPPLGPSKGIRDWLDPATSPRARLAFTRWHPLARVDVVEDATAVTWTVPSRGGAPPPEHQIIYDGDAATPILHLEQPIAEHDFLGSIPSALPHVAVRPDSVLVIGVGGGIDVLAALHAGARFVEGVEINPVTHELMTGRYRTWSGDVYGDPRVRLVVGEGRSIVRASPRRYDLIQMSLIDTFAATAAGAYSLSESYLYTVEAFSDYLARLTPRGAVAVTRFLHEPPREVLRLCAVARAALIARGAAEPARHFLVAAQGAYATVIVGADPFTPEEALAFVRTAVDSGAMLIYVPGAPIRNPIAVLIAGPDPERFIAEYPLRIDPVSDNRPFFFQYGRFRDATPFRTVTSRDDLVAPSGHSLLVTMLIVTGAVAAIMILLPLLLVGRRRGGAGEMARAAVAAPAAAGAGARGAAGARGTSGAPDTADLAAVLYFAGLGLAFILVEIAAMQQFALVLGHPTYAVSVVLFSLLLAAGAGSLASARQVGPGERRLGMAIAAVAAILLCEAMFAGPVFALLLSLPWALRALAAVLWVAIPGFGMGMFLPAGVRILAARRPDLVGWAFGANGFASVVGSVLSVLLAMLAGFRTTVALAAALYLVAFLVLRLARRS